MYQEYIDDSDYENRYARQNEWIKSEMEDKAVIALGKLAKAIHPDYIHVFADLIVENYHGRIACNIAKSLDITEDEIFSLDRDDYNYQVWLKDQVLQRMEDYEYELVEEYV